jgi:DNA modification methylase
MMRNTLYYGDNLQVIREHIPGESVDLVYLDPPFNSNASYNVLFRERTGEESPAQIKAFTDTWEWTQETEYTFEVGIVQNPAVPSCSRRKISRRTPAALRQSSSHSPSNCTGTFMRIRWTGPA